MHRDNPYFSLQVIDLTTQGFLALTDRFVLYGEGNGQMLVFVPANQHISIREITAALTWYAQATGNEGLAISTIDPRPPGLRIVK